MDDEVVCMVYPHPESVTRKNVAHPLDEEGVAISRNMGLYASGVTQPIAMLEASLPVVL